MVAVTIFQKPYFSEKRAANKTLLYIMRE